MKKHLLLMLATVLAVSLLSGCSVWNYPQSIEQVRQFETGIAKGTESFLVNRPFLKVKRSLITQSKKCFNIKTYRSQTYNQGRAGVTEEWEYHPNIEVSEGKVTLVLQKELVGGNLAMVGKVPPGGNYALVLDATAKTKTTTQIDFHWMKGFLSDNKHDLVIAWVKEGSTACPAL